MSITWGTQYGKLKTNLRLAINRLKLMGKKKTEMGMKARTEIADYITGHKEDRARIRVEHIIREDFLVEAYELLEMYCDLLLARFGLIEQMKTLDDGIAEAVISILWAAPRIATDIAEFKTISDQLTHKYGKPFAEAARGNQLESPAKVAPKLIAKLSAHAPPKPLVERYMIEIANAAGIPFTPDPNVMREDEVRQAEEMLIKFKEQGEGGGPPTVQEGYYGWNLPGGQGGPPPPGYPGGGYPGGGASPFPPPGGAPPPPPHGGGHFGGGGGGNIYEVPSAITSKYDQVPGGPSGFSTPSAYEYAVPPSSGVIQLPQIGPNGMPIGHNDNSGGGGQLGGGGGGNYPFLSQRNSLIDDKKSSSGMVPPPSHLPSGGPSAPPQSLRKPEEHNDLSFPEVPSTFIGGGGSGGNGGGSGGGDLDFDDLAKRFDQLKKK